MASQHIITILKAAAVATGLLLLTGCHTDMWIQPKVKPLQESDFFPDKQASRPKVAHTVALGQLHTDEAYTTGLVNGKLVEEIPAAAIAKFESPAKMLERGRERFDIACSPCHGRVGDGKGMIAQRGFSEKRPPASYHTDRLRNIPVGHFFDVITKGFGTMYPAVARVPDYEDRWAIAAYIRALQLSQRAPKELLNDEDRRRLQEAGQKPSESEAPHHE
jgi:mono/diheme cytochrome c family protein